MGLDLEITKFKKSYFDTNKNQENCLNCKYEDNRNGVPQYVTLSYWHKHECILGVLTSLGGYRICDHSELTRRDLKKALRIAVRGSELIEAYYNADEMKVLAKVLRRILHQTDFKEETIAFSWIT